MGTKAMNEELIGMQVSILIDIIMLIGIMILTRIAVGDQEL